MFTQIIPAPWRWAILAALFAAAGGLGWVQGAGHVQTQWQAAQSAQAQAVAVQSVHVATITAAQTRITEEVADNVETRIAAVRSYYAGRVRQQPTNRAGAVPPAADPTVGLAPGSADDGSPPAGSGIHGESWPDLAERCAVTTELLLGWQEWWSAVEGVNQLD